MPEKVLWAKDHKELFEILEACMKKHYQKINDVMDWLNMQSLRVEVWKN